MKTSGYKKLVRWKGFEPSRYCYRQPLKLVRLPVPPPPQNQSVAATQNRFAGLRKPAGHFCYCPIVTDCPAISSKINRSLVLTFAKREAPIRPTATASGSGMPEEAAEQVPERESFQEPAQARASKRVWSCCK
jgi:hypothetical protein